MNPLFVKGAYFFEYIQPGHRPELYLVVGTHLLDNPQLYLVCLQRMGTLAMILLNSKSICRATVEGVARRFQVFMYKFSRK